MIDAVTRDPWIAAKRRAREWLRSGLHWTNALCDPSPKLLVLLYHRVLPRVACNPLQTIVSTDTFMAQLEAVARRYPIIPLDDAIERQATRRHRTRVVLTFDDGYWDNYDIVYPILRAKGLPATFFLPTGYIERGQPLWDWHVILGALHTDHTTIRMHGAQLQQGPRESRLGFAFRVMDALKAAPREQLEDVATELRARAAGRVPTDYFDGGCMTWEQARTMQQQGMHIGAHSVSHRSLARIPLAEAREEVAHSKASIEAQTGMPCRYFAFPFGSRRDYTSELIAYVRDAGFTSCMLNIHGYNRSTDSAMRLKRIVMTDTTSVRWLLG